MPSIHLRLNDPEYQLATTIAEQMSSPLRKVSHAEAIREVLRRVQAKIDAAEPAPAPATPAEEPPTEKPISQEPAKPAPSSKGRHGKAKAQKPKRVRG